MSYKPRTIPCPDFEIIRIEVQRDSTTVFYSFAIPADKERIRRLLSKCELPTIYVHRHLKSFIVAKSPRKIVGVIGLETYGRFGLIRSLCVDELYRNRGIAKILNKKILAYARAQKIERLYLFTVDAEEFASKMIFRKIAKRQIPKRIRSTWQYRSFGPYPVACILYDERSGRVDVQTHFTWTLSETLIQRIRSRRPFCLRFYNFLP